ncbi:MAG: hypothetical protein R6U78_08895 [Bacteroidales bacterium]
MVDNLRTAAWILPFSSFIMIFFFQVLFGLDLAASLSFGMVVVYSVVSVLLAVLSLIITRALRPENLHKRWVNWLLTGSGSQVDEALGFLDRIREFEHED